MAEVAKSAIVATSPKPLADAFDADSKTFIASALSKPADVIKNIASLVSALDIPVCFATLLDASANSSKAEPETPTSASIFPRFLSKSIAILTAAPPANAVMALNFCNPAPMP